MGADHGGTRAVLAGSSWEYEWGHDRCFEYATPLRPTSLYGACKHALQTMLSAFAAERRLSAAWGRIFSVYGPHDDPSRLVPSVIMALLDGRTARCTAGSQVRDFMFVSDVAEAFVALLDTAVTGAINIGSGHPVAVRSVVGTIAELLGTPDRIELGALPPRAEDPPALVPDVTRLTQEVGWRPATELTGGLRTTIDWWRSQRQLLATGPG